MLACLVPPRVVRPELERAQHPPDRPDGVHGHRLQVQGRRRLRRGHEKVQGNHPGGLHRAGGIGSALRRRDPANKVSQTENISLFIACYLTRINLVNCVVLPC